MPTDSLSVIQSIALLSPRRVWSVSLVQEHQPESRPRLVFPLETAPGEKLIDRAEGMKVQPETGFPQPLNQIDQRCSDLHRRFHQSFVSRDNKAQQLP